MMYRERAGGFTLIELVIVIVIVAVIGAVALPRFVDLGDQAEQSSADGIAASFKSAIEQVKLAWNVNGTRARVRNLPGFGTGTVDTNSIGYPIGTRKTTNNDTIQFGNAGCLDIWNGIQSPAPTISATANTQEWRAYAHSTNRQCDFVYRKNGDTAGRTTAQVVIRYNSNNGAIKVCGRAPGLSPC